MRTKKEAKQQLRAEIANKKQAYSKDALVSMSDEIFSIVEITGFFQQAKTIFIYSNLSDEVATRAFIDKWKVEKDFYLPAVVDNKLVFRKLCDESKCRKSKLGILEPISGDFDPKKKIDLVIVPGLAFDRKMNRLGRGKGFYDHFLTNTQTSTKMGVCFDFQLIESVPTDEEDIKMDVIVSENDLIW